MQKSILSFVIIFFLSINFVWAQVKVKGRAFSSGKNVIASIYYKDSHLLTPIDANGQFEATLPRFEECILLFYGIDLLPRALSFNTYESCPQPIPVSVNLTTGDIESKGYLLAGPSQRFVMDGRGYKTSKFDLDNLEDKEGYASLMAIMARDLKIFYEQKKFPEERISNTSNVPQGKITKTDHQIGEEIYQLLQQKKVLKQQVEQQQARFAANSANSCQQELALLNKEMEFAQLEYDLSNLYLQKEQIQIRKKEFSQQSAGKFKLNKAKDSFVAAEASYKIAALNLENKELDCQADKLEVQIQNSQGNAARLNIKKAEMDINRLQKRYKNARQLTEYHNQLANKKTGRDRIVELAYAQKYISEQEELQLFQKKNIVSIWKYKNQQSGKYQEQIELAQNAYTQQREIAWQAEMAYLEHMWHLRKEPEVEDLIADIYNRQNGILAVKLNTREEEQLAEIPEAPPSSGNAMLNNIAFKEKKGEEGNDVQTFSLEEDYYEIVINSKGQKQYSKNNKPITKLTYRLETQRKFGEMLENIRYEEEKNTLWEFFKRKIQQ